MTPEEEVKADTAKYDALLQAVGQALTDWARVEEGLFQIFFHALACPALGPPACAFFAVDNVRTKLQMIDSMVRHSRLPKASISTWEALQKRCNTARADRNDSFRWDYRKVTDGECTVEAIKAGEGKRLMYRDPVRK